jgi:hypothetical protein
MPSRFAVAAFVVFLGGFAFAACGGELAAEDDDGAASADASVAHADGSTKTQPVRDAGDGADVVVSEASVTGAIVSTRSADAGSCWTLPTSDCGEGISSVSSLGDTNAAIAAASSTFVQTIAACHAATGGCGEVFGDFDPEGCLDDLRMEDPNDAFIACVNAKFSTRWSCFEGQYAAYGAVIECPSH